MVAGTERARQWQWRREGQAGSSTSKTRKEGLLRSCCGGREQDEEQGGAGGRERIWGERGREVVAMRMEEGSGGGDGEGEAMAMAERGAGGQQHLENAERGVAAEE